MWVPTCIRSLLLLWVLLCVLLTGKDFNSWLPELESSNVGGRRDRNLFYHFEYNHFRSYVSFRNTILNSSIFSTEIVLLTYFQNWMVLQEPQKMTRAQILGHLVAPILGEGFVFVMIILSSDFLFTNVNIEYII